MQSIKQLGASALDLEPLALSLDVVTSPLLVQRCLVSGGKHCHVPAALGLFLPARAHDSALHDWECWLWAAKQCWIPRR